jgi:hypothetical protein
MLIERFQYKHALSQNSLQHDNRDIAAVTSIEQFSGRLGMLFVILYEIANNQLGHATYLFSKPVNMTEFLALYGKVTKDDIRRNRGSLAERLGFWGRLIHGHDPRTWLKELKTRFGETVDYALCES